MKRILWGMVLALAVYPNHTVPAQTAPASTPAPAPAPGGKPAPAGSSAAAAASPLDRAVLELQKEAQDLDNYEKPDAPALFRRPHPAVSTIGGESTNEVLDRMLQPFTGNEYRDTYIRWHLLNVLTRTSQAERRPIGPKLLQLLQKMPGAISGKERQTHYYEPPEIASKYFSLINSGNVVVGYPPFQRELAPPESYKEMDPERIARVKANLAEAALLRDKFKTIRDEKAVKWNERIRQVNYIIRLYRGELIYALLQTGDPEMLKAVFSEIEKQARAKNGVTFDLMAYVYLAAFDGVLDLYPGPVLMECSRKLESMAKVFEGYTRYGGMDRNFAEYAFHMIYMLREIADSDTSMISGRAPAESTSPGGGQ